MGNMHSGICLKVLAGEVVCAIEIKANSVTYDQEIGDEPVINAWLR